MPYFVSPSWPYMKKSMGACQVHGAELDKEQRFTSFNVGISSNQSSLAQYTRCTRQNSETKKLQKYTVSASGFCMTRVALHRLTKP